MKIKTTIYNTSRPNKKSNQLEIGIVIELPTASQLNTSAIVQLCPLDYLADKSPAEAFGLLYLSAIVYAIDRSIDRNVYSIDGWSRVFDVDISLPGYGAFRPVEGEINAMLSFLTGDYWNCHFVGDATVRYLKCKPSTYLDGITQVNLFSGGMDSLIGAIDYMTTHPDGKLFMASHYDGGMPGPKSDQERLKKHFRTRYCGHYCDIGAIRIESKVSKELSCRSRSLMFLSIAIVVASYANCGVVVPENGSVSLNYPLSSSRRASCSTRTTHPVFLKMFRDVIAALGLTVDVINPYEKKTKGEMVKECKDKKNLLDLVALSNSCGKRSKHQYYYDNSRASHCGRCMPCIYRKAALVGEHDPTTYGNKLITLFKKKLGGVAADIYAMLNFLKKDLAKEQIRRELRVAGMGGFPDLDEYVALVERTRAELKSMIIADNNRMILNYMGW